MQRPPDRRTPPILLTRPTYEWIARVNQKHKQLDELRLSADQKDQLDRWAEIEFVYATLKLEGVEVTRENVSRLVLNSSSANALEDSDPESVALLASLRKVASLARANGKAAALSIDLLLDVHSVPGREQGFRKSAGDTTREPRPVLAEHLPAVLETACQWYTASSFAELHPIEQAAIVFLRLIEIQPFERRNERSALLAASLFTLRSELPPIVIKPEMHSAYRNALDEGSRMNTKPMVEMAAEAVEKSLTEMIGKVEGQKEKGKRKK